MFKEAEEAAAACQGFRPQLIPNQLWRKLNCILFLPPLTMEIPLTFLCSYLSVIDVFISSRPSGSNSIFVHSSLLWPNKQRLFSETSPSKFVSALHVNLLVSKSFPSGLLPKSNASARSIREHETQASSDLSLTELYNEVPYCSSKCPSPSSDCYQIPRSAQKTTSIILLTKSGKFSSVYCNM